MSAKARHCSQLGKHFRPSLMLDLFIVYGDSRKLIFGLPLNVYLSILGNVALIKELLFLINVERVSSINVEYMSFVIGG